MAQMPLLTYFFLGSGWPWVGEFVYLLTIYLYVFLLIINLVYRKHPDSEDDLLFEFSFSHHRHHRGCFLVAGDSSTMWEIFGTPFASWASQDVDARAVDIGHAPIDIIYGFGRDFWTLVFIMHQPTTGKRFPEFFFLLFFFVREM